MKAVLLYPMNALATDQAMRINDLLTRPELKDVTAGLYIGEAPDTAYARVLTERSEIRSAPAGHPDHELQDAGPAAAARRGPRVVAGRGYRLRGGGRVPHLRRRAGHRRGDAAAPAGRRHEPLASRASRSGSICPVATSATLGEGGDEARIREVAEQVFGTEFDEDSVITERRLPAEGFLGEIDYSPPPSGTAGTRGAGPTRGWTTRRWRRSPSSSPVRRPPTRRSSGGCCGRTSSRTR